MLDRRTKQGGYVVEVLDVMDWEARGWTMVRRCLNLRAGLHLVWRSNNSFRLLKAKSQKHFARGDSQCFYDELRGEKKKSSKRKGGYEEIGTLYRERAL